MIPVLIRGALIGIATTVALRVNSDPDLWGHLRFGLDFWSTFTIPAVDTYSFTSDRVWINHEWLFEVVLAFVYSIGGTLAIATMSATIALCALGIARLSAHRAGMDGWRLDALTVGIFLLGVAPLVQTMRPQVVSMLSFITLLAVMREFDRGHRRALFVLPPLFLVWANSHGGWVVGGAVLALWISLREARDRLMPLGIGIASAAATFLNPYGIGLWRFLIETVRFERADIIEWDPIPRAPLMLIPWIVSTAVFAFGVSRAQRERLPYAAICVFLAVASFRVTRLVPFFSLAALMLFGPLLADRIVRPRIRITARDLVGAAFICLICVASATGGEARLGCLKPTGSFYVDDRAGAFLRENAAKGRLFVWFNWGEYALWHLGPSLKVSIEGRRETVYSEAVITAHNAFYENGPGAREYLERLAPDYVWLPASLPVSKSISSWGWTRIFESDLSIVWARENAQGSWRPPSSIVSSCFPAA